MQKILCMAVMTMWFIEGNIAASAKSAAPTIQLSKAQQLQLAKKQAAADVARVSRPSYSAVGKQARERLGMPEAASSTASVSKLTTAGSSGATSASPAKNVAVKAPSVAAGAASAAPASAASVASDEPATIVSVRDAAEQDDLLAPVDSGVLASPHDAVDSLGRSDNEPVDATILQQQFARAIDERLDAISVKMTELQKDAQQLLARRKTLDAERKALRESEQQDRAQQGQAQKKSPKSGWGELAQDYNEGIFAGDDDQAKFLAWVDRRAQFTQDWNAYTQDVRSNKDALAELKKQQKLLQRSKDELSDIVTSVNVKDFATYEAQVVYVQKAISRIAKRSDDEDAAREQSRLDKSEIQEKERSIQRKEQEKKQEVEKLRAQIEQLQAQQTLANEADTPTARTDWSYDVGPQQQVDNSHDYQDEDALAVAAAASSADTRTVPEGSMAGSVMDDKPFIRSAQMTHGVGSSATLLPKLLPKEIKEHMRAKSLEQARGQQESMHDEVDL